MSSTCVGVGVLAASSVGGVGAAWEPMVLLQTHMQTHVQTAALSTGVPGVFVSELALTLCGRLLVLLTPFEPLFLQPPLTRPTGVEAAPRDPGMVRQAAGFPSAP